MLQKMYSKLNKSLGLPASCFVPVIDFLQGAGQGQMATQVSFSIVFLPIFAVPSQ